MNTTKKEIAKHLRWAIKELAIDGVLEAGICAALGNKLASEGLPNAWAFSFMIDFMNDSRLYLHGIGPDGELNDHRIYTILLLDQLSIEDIEFYLDCAPKGCYEK